jgi:DNA polymerase-3 subunit gamma/tau
MFVGQSRCGKSLLAEIVALVLTCKNSKDGEPCLACENCKNNLKALEGNYKSDILSKENMALIDKKDLRDKVKEIFRLQPKIGERCVYILEEFHILKAEEQTVFLEELSNVPSDVYIIICSNKLYKIIPEIKGRATRLDVKVPNTEENLGLLKNYLQQQKVKAPNDKVLSWLIRHLGNVPGEIIKTADFLIGGGAFTEENVKAYLGFTETARYVEFFEKCRGSMLEFVDYTEELKETDLNNFQRGLREFVLNLMSALYGGDKTNFSTDERTRLKQIFSVFSEKHFLELMDYTGKQNYQDDVDVYYNLLGYRRFFMGESVKSIIKSSEKQTRVDEIKSINRFNLIENKKGEVDTTLDEDKIESILGGMKVFKGSNGENEKDTEFDRLQLEEETESVSDQDELGSVSFERIK